MTNHDVQWGMVKKKPHRRRGWWWFGGAAVLFLLLIGMAYTVLFSGALRVQKMEVTGASLVPEQKLLTALSTKLADNWVRGILGSENILFWMFRRGTVTDIAGVPLAASVDFSANLFARTVSVSVHERKFLGVWCAADNICRAFDQAGVFFEEAPSVEGTLIVRVTDENARPLSPGYPILPRAAWVKNFFSVVETLKGENLAVAEFVVKPFSLQEWWARLTSGTVLYFNANIVPENLAAILESFKVKPDFGKLTYLDFRVPNRVYFR